MAVNVSLHSQGLEEYTRFSNQGLQVFPLTAPCLLGLSLSEVELLLLKQLLRLQGCPLPLSQAPLLLGVGTSVSMIHSENRTLLFAPSYSFPIFPR